MPHPSPPGAYEFDSATELRPRPDGTTFDTAVDPRWTVGDKPNGGYLLALLGRAARTAGAVEGQAREAVASSITYLRAPWVGPAQIRTEVLRQGRTAGHVRAVLVQEGADLVDAVFVLSALAAAATPRYNDIAPLDIPPPGDCLRLPPTMPGGVHVAIMEVTELRVDPTVIPFDSPRPGPGDPLAELRGWTRFADGRPPDELSLLYFADAIPPATFPLGSSGWVPTLQMSVYVRSTPAPGWLGIRITAHLVTGGMVDETCTLWDTRGEVVAQATQLARLRFPDEVA